MRLAARADAAPATADAEIVSALRAAGALILGKTQTTEFAYFDPSPARNPHHRNPVVRVYFGDGLQRRP